MCIRDRMYSERIVVLDGRDKVATHVRSRRLGDWCICLLYTSPMLAVLAVVVFLVRSVWRILSSFLSLCMLALFILILCVIL